MGKQSLAGHACHCCREPRKPKQQCANANTPEHCASSLVNAEPLAENNRAILVYVLFSVLAHASAYICACVLCEWSVGMRACVVVYAGKCLCARARACVFGGARPSGRINQIMIQTNY